MKKIIWLAISVAFSLSVLSVSARADQIKDRLDSLEKTLQSLQSDSASRNEKVANALATIEEIRQKFQSLQGTAEANEHIIVSLQDDLSRIRQDMGDRMSALEERLSIYDEQITKAVEKVLPQVANEMEAYQKALDLVQKSDFLTAVSSFKSFIKTYPKSEFADNAQYWVGECYFTLKDYQKAIKEFQLVIDKYAKSDKISSAILKQGLSFMELGMNDEAKMFFNKVIKDSPGSDDASRAQEKISKLEQKAKQANQDSNIPLAPGVKVEEKKDATPQQQPTGVKKK